MLKNYISCKICPEIPFIFYQYKNSSLILNYLCPNGHKFQINIDEINSFKKSCGKCGKEIKDEFNYSSIQQYYLCKDCQKLDKNVLNIYSIYSSFQDDNKYNDIINEFKEHFNELIKFNEKFIYSKYYSVYRIFISDFMNLFNNKYYNQELIINMKNFKKIDFKYLLLINDNYEIIFEENIPQILFSNFYNISFRKYYNSELNDFSEILKLVKLYEKHKITATEIDEEKFLKFIKKSIKNVTKSSEEYFTKIENKLKDLKIEENIVELKLTLLYNDFRDIINNNLYSIYSIPSIFVLKRKLIKGIIDFIHSIEYKNLEPAIPNYKFLFMFFSRLYEIKNEIKDNKLYNNIEYVLYVIKEKLYDLINTEENKLKKYKVNPKNKVIEKFTEEEILLINQYCSKYEKEIRESKCEYSVKDNKEILNLKFMLSFLNYIKEESNDLIHILLEKNSSFFYTEEKQKNIPNNLKDYLNNLYKNEIISEKVSGDKLIEMFFFESNINDIKNKFLNESEQFLNNNDIKLNENLPDSSSDENEIIDYINNLNKIYDYFQEIINKKDYKIYLKEENFENFKLGVKRKRNIIVNIENYTQFIIKEIYENLKYVELILINSQNLKEKIIKKINHIDELNLKKRKIEIILNEMKNYPMKIFSLEKIFVEWKKKELNKIKLNPDIYNLVYFELEKCSLNNFKILLKYYVDKNKNKHYYFYIEEGDIYTNLFLYQNQISPQICKLLYKYIK